MTELLQVKLFASLVQLNSQTRTKTQSCLISTFMHFYLCHTVLEKQFPNFSMHFQKEPETHLFINKLIHFPKYPFLRIGIQKTIRIQKTILGHLSESSEERLWWQVLLSLIYNLGIFNLFYLI